MQLKLFLNDYIDNDSGNGLARNSQQAITWSNVIWYH